MGETLNEIRPTFNRSFRVEGRSDRLTAEAGAIILREALEKLGTIDLLTQRLEDPRDKRFVTHSLEELLRTRILLHALGWIDQNDANDLRDDPCMRVSVSDRKGLSPLEHRTAEERERCHNPNEPDGLASQPTLSRLLGYLSSPENLEVLRQSLVEMAGHRIRLQNKGHKLRYLTIDVDSLPVEAHGNQPGSAYNGYYGCNVFHPLIASAAETGDLLDVQLREGSSHTAFGATEFILSLIDRVEQQICKVASVRFDAGFPEDSILCALEQRKIGYVARVRNNAVLDRMAADYAVHPTHRPIEEGRLHFYERQYGAESWSRKRRVVLVVVEQEDQLHPRHFWLITNWDADYMPAQQLLELYRQRGKAEAHYGEWMDVLSPHLSSAARQKTYYRSAILDPSTKSPIDSFARNEATLLISSLAYNLLHMVRALMERGTRHGWSIRRVQQKILKTAGRVILHGRRATLVLSKSIIGAWSLLWKEIKRLEALE
jgi:hypothetical protein